MFGEDKFEIALGIELETSLVAGGVFVFLNAVRGVYIAGMWYIYTDWIYAVCCEGTGSFERMSEYLGETPFFLLG